MRGINVDYQLSAEVSGVVRGRRFNFLLIEGSSPIRLDLELALRKRFPEAKVERLFPGNGQPLHNLVWSHYDLVLVSCPDFLDKDLAWLQAIERRDDGLPIVVALTPHDEAGRRAIWSGADMYLLLEDSNVEFAAHLDAVLEVGRMLRRYPLDLPDWHFVEVLHNSENAVIFLVENRAAQRAVIKRFKFDVSGMGQAAFAGFLHDAQLLSEIAHPCLARIWDVGVSGRAVYVVMEYVEGQTLASLLSGCGPDDFGIKLKWFRQVVEALGVIHSLGLLHRDLKASNVLVRDDGTPVLLDYGVESKLLIGSGFLREDEIYCTPLYVSPERIVGEPASVQSDLYALGVLLYEMLVGEKPFVGRTLQEVLQRQLFDPIPTVPAAFAPYQGLVNKLLAKLPDQRLDSAQAVLDWLNLGRLAEVAS